VYLYVVWQAFILPSGWTKAMMLAFILLFSWTKDHILTTSSDSLFTKSLACLLLKRMCTHFFGCCCFKWELKLSLRHG